MQWCDDVGAKLTDATIDPSDVLKGFIVPTEVNERPALVPLALEWPIQLFLDINERIDIKRGTFSRPLMDADLTVTSFPVEVRSHSPCTHRTGAPTTRSPSPTAASASRATALNRPW